MELHTEWENCDEFDDGVLLPIELDDLPNLDLASNIKLKKRDTAYTLCYRNIILVDNIPSSCINLKYNGKSPLEWAVSRMKPRSNSTKSKNVDNINLYYEENSLEPNKQFLSCLKKIITASLLTSNVISEINEFQLTFDA